MLYSMCVPGLGLCSSGLETVTLCIRLPSIFSFNLFQQLHEVILMLREFNHSSHVTEPDRAELALPQSAGLGALCHP